MTGVQYRRKRTDVNVVEVEPWTFFQRPQWPFLKQFMIQANDQLRTYRFKSPKF